MMDDQLRRLLQDLNGLMAEVERTQRAIRWYLRAREQARTDAYPKDGSYDALPIKP